MPKLLSTLKEQYAFRTAESFSQVVGLVPLHLIASFTFPE